MHFRHSTHFSLIVFFSLLLVQASWAKYVAVLETVANPDLNGEVTQSDRIYMTDVLRSEAVKILPAQQNYTIMTRENINMMLPPGKSIEECEGSCLAETGKNIAADYVAQARIGKFGQSLTLSVELYETASNKLVASFNGQGENVESLMVIIKSESPSFFKAIKGNSGFGDFSSGGSFSFQANKKYIIEIESDPIGALPTIDGKGYAKCVSTPCKIQIDAGEHRFVASKEHYDDAETVVDITENNQKVFLKLNSNLGFLDIRPAMPGNFGGEDKLRITIDSTETNPGTVSLDPGVHSILISHPCYDPISFNVSISKGQTETFNNSLTRGIGGLELDASYNGDPQAVPVLIDGNDAGSTPFAGEVPMCAKIEVVHVGKHIDVPVNLEWHQVVKKSIELPPPQIEPAQVYKDTIQDTIQEESPKYTQHYHNEPSIKRFWIGVTIGGVYNDLYGTHFGLNDIQQESDYELTIKGSDDILHNFWGIGGTAGISGLFIFNPSFYLRSGVSATFRHGNGKSNISAILSWDDENKSDEKSDMEIEYDLKQVNIDIPLFARYNIPNILYVEAGPTASFNIYSKNKTTITDVFGSSTYKKNGGLKLCEFDLAAGIGVMRPLGNSMIDFGIRFVLGLTKLSDSDDSPKSMQGQFNITYWFL